MVFETIPFASLGTAAGRFILTTLGAGSTQKRT